jgi:hypothetical protein
MPETVRVHGLVVASDVPLNQGAPCFGAPVDLTVTYGPARQIGPDPAEGELLGRHERPEGGLFSSVTRTTDGVLLRCHGVCDLVMDHGATSLVVHVDPRAACGLESVVLGGMGLATVLMLRGHLLLHASAVSVGGEALAVVGRSGMGKSTVATLLCGSGALMVSDDVLRVDLDEGRALVRRGSTEARLRASARSTAPASASLRVTPDERSAVSLPGVDVDELPLRAVVVPYPDRTARDVVVDPVTRADALVILSAFPRLVGWVDPSTSGVQFTLLADLVRRVPTVVARLPWGPPFPDDLGHRLLTALAAQPSAASAAK